MRRRDPNPEPGQQKASPLVLEQSVANYFRDQFRAARATALSDAEGSQDILFAIERFGSHLTKRIGTLDEYRGEVTKLAKCSPFAKYLPDCYPGFHTPLARLYQAVMIARNDALHHGAYARNLTANAVSLVLILEDALMTDARAVGDYMVRNVATAFLWQPVSFVRQTMLENAFSYLPIYLENQGWQVISDHALAVYVRSYKQRDERRQDSLARTLQDAVGNEQLQLEAAYTCPPETTIEEAITNSMGKPMLIVHSADSSRLLGILTPFDLL